MSEDPRIWQQARLVNWDDLLKRRTDPEDVPWIIEPLAERGKLYALYADDPKEGKSLFAQCIAAALAAGRSVLGGPPGDPVPVLYLDFENAEDDLYERFFTDMGYKPADLKLLSYASYPQMPKLDTPEGGKFATWLAWRTAARVVFVDTTSRIIGGSVTDNNTFTDLYNYTFQPLKAMGCTAIRLDHAGKDAARGQLGAIGKATDVDAVWRLTSRKYGSTIESVHLEPTLARNRHAAAFDAQCLQDPLRFKIASVPLTGRQQKLAADLDRLGVPPDAGRQACRAALTAAQIGAGGDDLAAAIRHRKSGGGSQGGAGGGTQGGGDPDFGALYRIADHRERKPKESG